MIPGVLIADRAHRRMTFVSPQGWELSRMTFRECLELEHEALIEAELRFRAWLNGMSGKEPKRILFGGVC